MHDTSWERGYVHVYTGDGKGKTTAALGLCLRAAGAGLKVYIAQFIKGLPYAEHDALGRFSDLITCVPFGRGCFIRRKPEQEDLDAAAGGLAAVCEVLDRGEHRLVILDEVNVALELGLLPLVDVLDLLDRRPTDVELVLTGRGAPPELIERADLVTEMREVKHYYQQGVLARSGVEM